MNFPIAIPTIPKEFLEREDDPIYELTGGHHPMFFIERFDYPESGGMYVYKFGAEPVEKPNEVHRRVLTQEEIPSVEEEEAKLGFIPRESTVYLCDNCHKIVAYFVPKLEFKNRVDLLHPVEGFPDPKIMPKINEAKRLLVGYLKFFSSKAVLFSMALALFLPFKYKVKLLEKWLKSYNEVVWPVMHPFVQEKYFQKISQELRRFIANFLKALGMNGDVAENFAKVFSNLIEFDSAYNLFLQDIFSETTKEQLMDPRKEFVRLVGIFQQRSPNQKLKTLTNEIKLLSWVFVHPRVKRAFKEAVNMLELKNLHLTEGNRYHVLRMAGYDFMGRTIEDRSEEYFKMHGDNPPIPHYI